jgi:methylmalonyl-CoA mutase
MQVFLFVVDDAKKLYSGFDLVHALTSVSMIIMATHVAWFFMNAALINNVVYIKANDLRKEVEAKAIYKKSYLVGL